MEKSFSARISYFEKGVRGTVAKRSYSQACRQSERNHEPEPFSDQSIVRNGETSYQQIKYREQILRVGRRRTWPQRFKSREEKSHDFRRPTLRKTKQMRGLLHQKSSQQRGLFLPGSKLLQTTASDDKRKHELYLSLSARPQDINHIYNDHVSSDMDKEEFRTLCNRAWENRTVSPLLIWAARRMEESTE